MKMMAFPNNYKKTLLSGEKKMTIRVGEEMGKYRVGEKYRAASYEGKDWAIEIVIVDVLRIEMDRLPDLGVLKSEIEQIKNEGGTNTVEVIRFEAVA